MPLTFAETPLYYRDSQGQYHRVLSGADMTGYRTAAAQDAIDSAQDTNINSKLPLAGGTMTGAINMNSKKITNLPMPTADGDAVPKGYVDAVSTATSSITKLVSSGTLDSRTCVRKGNVVTVGGRIYGVTNNDGAQRAYFQIPEGFRPTVQDAKCMGAVKVLSSTNPTFPTVPIFVPTVVTIQPNGQVLFGGGQFADCIIDQVLFAGTYVV